MCCIPDYNCVIMSRGKARGSAEVCGDCGLQGLSEFTIVFREFSIFITFFIEAPFASLNRGE